MNWSIILTDLAEWVAVSSVRGIKEAVGGGRKNSVWLAKKAPERGPLNLPSKTSRHRKCFWFGLSLFSGCKPGFSQHLLHAKSFTIPLLGPPSLPVPACVERDVKVTAISDKVCKAQVTPWLGPNMCLFLSKVWSRCCRVNCSCSYQLSFNWLYEAITEWNTARLRASNCQKKIKLI